MTPPTTEKTTQPAKKQKANKLMFSQPFTDVVWETIFRWATVSALIFGGVGILSAFVSAWIGYEITDATQKEANQKIAEAHALSDLAKAEVAQAQVEIAKSNERIAILQTNTETAIANAENARAEQARLNVALNREQIERLRFQAQFAWRVIPAEAAAKMIEKLSAAPSSIEITFIASDPEATFFAQQLIRIFSLAKWNLSQRAGTYPGIVMFGVFAPGPDTAETRSVRDALLLAGIIPSTQEPPSFSMGSVSSNFSGTPAASITIGSKATPEMAGLIDSFNKMPSH